MKNRIGLNENHAIELAQKLNSLLCNYQVFYMNVRGFHWNIRGDKFFELHLKFEELYNDLLLKIDEIAERILSLGKVPFHTYTDYLQNSQVKPEISITDPKACIQSILNSFETILVLQREILQLSAQYNDEGTNSIMSDYIRSQEKLVWMYSAYLN
ncbi:MAG: Dps family protein [Bacteroidia bacterium]|nr:Dps family protein [Bacteroidia bacterium]